jgi:hypothetical protein
MIEPDRPWPRPISKGDELKERMEAEIENYIIINEKVGLTSEEQYYKSIILNSRYSWDDRNRCRAKFGLPPIDPRIESMTQDEIDKEDAMNELNSEFRGYVE